MRTTEGLWVTHGGVPCASCSTRGGYVRPGEAQPSRIRGCCPTCYEYHRDSDTLDQFLTLRPAHTSGEARVRLRDRVERMYDQQEAIAERVRVHECVPEAVVEGERNTERRIRNAEALGLILDVVAAA